MRSRASQWGIPHLRDLQYWPFIILLLILLVAGGLRWYGLAWDDGYLFHPDERQILLVASHLEPPRNLAEFFSPSSPLNPHFFAYGSLPIYLLRLLAPFAPASNITGPWADDSLARWIIFARVVSGFFDLGTIVLTFLLGRRLYGPIVGLVAAACVGLTVLDIQLSHFYAVDTLVAFFVLATLYGAVRLAEGPTTRWMTACGLTFGLALATKVSALPLIFPISFALWHARTMEQPFGGHGHVVGAQGRGPIRYMLGIWRGIQRPFLEICGIALTVFIMTQPYALIDWFEFGRDVIRESLVARGWLDYPYTLQYATTLPYLYQVYQTALWGMGVPLGIFAWGGAALFTYIFWRRRGWRGAFLLSWVMVYFIIIGAQYAKYPRYMLPLVPVLFVMATQAVFAVKWQKPISVAIFSLALGSALVYSLAFVSMYSREHPWLTASRWIFENVPPASTIAVEEWDDALPVQIAVGGSVHRGAEFETVTLSLYGQDNTAKLKALVEDLARTDVVVLASQRAYGSIARMPTRYPLTTRYYQKLFDGELGFELVASATNFPQIAGWSVADDPSAGLPFGATVVADPRSGSIWNWGFADESLTVYDHPQPLIFRKWRQLTSTQLYDLLLH